MMYVILDKVQALGLGFNLHTHITAHGKMILNEKEILMSNNIQGDTLDERVKNIGGKAMTEQELEQFKNTDE